MSGSREGDGESGDSSEGAQTHAEVVIEFPVKEGGEGVLVACLRTSWVSDSELVCSLPKIPLRQVAFYSVCFLFI